MMAIQQLNDLALYLSWPIWALESIMCLVGIILVVGFLQNFIFYENNSTKGNHIDVPKAFRMFQLQYFGPFFIIMLADWLQGTNMYTLYSSYGVNVGTLFLTGFLSSAIFGTFLGVYVDRWGRKLGCIVFCVLEIIINFLEHFPHMPSLMVGRILGGLSTSLLFSAFESWMVSEHRKLGFSEELLASTFAISSWGNAIMAICAGFVAQVAADVSGDIGPFQVAIALTFVTMLLILPWRENFGGADPIEEKEKNGKKKKDTNTTDGNTTATTDSSTIAEWLSKMVSLVTKNPIILCVGLSQAFFEGAVYTFVFMWVPSLLHVMGDRGALPTGLVFASFMLSMSIGGMLFGLLLPLVPGGAETLCILVYFISAVAMAVPIFHFSFWWVYISFLVLEGMVGMFNSCGATLRSRYYPEHLQSTIMGIFRLPLNLLVVAGTLLTNNTSNIPELQQVFKVVVGMHVVAMMLQIAMWYIAHGSSSSSSGSSTPKSSPSKSKPSSSSSSSSTTKAVKTVSPSKATKKHTKKD